MMDSNSEAEEDEFFESRDDIHSVSADLGSEGCGVGDIGALRYEFWTKKPDSVDERRDKFLRWVGLSSDMNTSGGRSIQRSKDNAVLANLDSQPMLFCSDDSLHETETENETETETETGSSVLVEDGGSAVEDNLNWKIKNFQDNGTEFVMDQQSEDGTQTTLREVGSHKTIQLDEFQQAIGSSPFVQQLLRKGSSNVFQMVDPKKTVKRNWFQRLSADKTKEAFTDDTSSTDEINQKSGSASRRVRVHVSKKKSKELSSLYKGQEFQAHEGSISTMKFSHDGRYLASAGVDGIVRVWEVLEDDILNNKLNSQDTVVPSCLYDDGKEKNSLLKRSMRTSSADSAACVVLPPKSFQLSEKPIHEFRGHKGEVLDLSWSSSNNGNLLSSSVDKTARLWRVGQHHCLRVYSHNDFVTCVEFNPVDDSQFISGSLDGKLRIWEVEGGRVIDWTDIREIVTALCYCPNGKGGIVGSMDGNCRFYEVIDKRLQLGPQICLMGKKKLPGKRITGFQYFPSDTSKVIVTCADSQTRILCGTNVICKFKGSQFRAYLTADGEHIVSVSEDSNVNVWNYSSNQQHQKKKSKSSLQKSESFFSPNTSIAIPWAGFSKNNKQQQQLEEEEAAAAEICNIKNICGLFDEKLHASCLNARRRSIGLCFDAAALYKGSAATWPEEKLLESSNITAVTSDFKFLKNTSHLWGLVIVTAGWDGRITTFLNYGLPIRL